MKKVIVLFLLMLMVFSGINADSVKSTEPYSVTKKLNVAYSYNKDLYYRFIFSDVQTVKGGFEDLFENSSIDWIKMTNVENGILKNDTPLYIHWMVDEMTPIQKLTLEVTGPLTNEKNETLDWFVSVEGKGMIGGKGGYGPEHAIELFNGQIYSDSIIKTNDSVQLKLWSENVTGKTAGRYIGTLVLNVYGEI